MNPAYLEGDLSFTNITLDITILNSQLWPEIGKNVLVYEFYKSRILPSTISKSLLLLLKSLIYRHNMEYKAKGIFYINIK